MPKFLIEVPHAEELLACTQVIERFLNYGSHFATQADRGCKDDVHKAWITIETASKEDARNILPPAYRDKPLSCNSTSSPWTKSTKFSRIMENKIYWQT